MADSQLKVMFAVVTAVMASAPVAQAQDRRADWLKPPSARDIASVWPAAAMKEGIGGKAIISCIVTVQGALRECRVAAETPPGKGFGGAAIALATQFVMRPALKGGVPVESRVGIPVDFPRPDRATGSHLRAVTDTDMRPDRVYTHLPWVRAPDNVAVLAAYPAKARAAKVGGTAVVDCRLNADGTVSACRTLREAPEGQGFGAAARSLAPKFMAPTTNGRGEPLAPARVHIPVVFAAAALESSSPVIGQPEWRALPEPQDFAAVMPAAARKAGVYQARVVMICTVGADGGLASCRAESETPAGLGFADAAIALASTFRMGVWSNEGLPVVGGNVRIPIRFDMRDTAPAGSR